jgi:hypothetical protein
MCGLPDSFNNLQRLGRPADWAPRSRTKIMQNQSMGGVFILARIFPPFPFGFCGSTKLEKIAWSHADISKN